MDKMDRFKGLIKLVQHVAQIGNTEMNIISDFELLECQQPFMKKLNLEFSTNDVHDLEAKQEKLLPYKCPRFTDPKMPLGKNEVDISKDELFKIERVVV